MARLILIFLIVWPAYTLAESGLVFRRDILTIHPKTVPVVQSEEESEQAPEAPVRASIKIATEIRSEQALQLNWVHSLSRIGEKQAMMILFNPPRFSAIEPQNVYQPLDILTISPEGRIVQIVPNLVLFELAELIESNDPIRGRLFLNGGMTESLGIEPGDRVEHPLFQPKPTILTP